MMLAWEDEHMHVALVGAEFEENLAVRYLWGALEAAGHEVTPVVFNRGEDIESAARQLVATGAEIAGFSMVFTYRARQFASLATRARELGYAGVCVAGGHFAAFNADTLLSDIPAFDAVACGEGEIILCELVDALRRGRGLATVDGVVWRDGNRLCHNRPALKPPDLDVLAPPPRKQPHGVAAGQTESLVAEHRSQIHADDHELGMAGRSLLEELQAEARSEPPPAARTWVRSAAAAGLAATLTVSAAACKGQDATHPSEMAPVPTEPAPGPDGTSHPAEMAPMPPELPPGEPDDAGAPLQPLPPESPPLPPVPPDHTHPAEMAPPPPPPPPPPTEGYSPTGLLPRPLVRRAVQLLADYVWPPQDVELELWFDSEGRPHRIALRGSDLDDAVVRHAGSALASLHTSDPDVRNRKFILRLSAAELRGARPQPPTHPREKAPRPPQPPTHPRERAPQPPSHTREMAPLPPPPPPPRRR